MSSQKTMKEAHIQPDTSVTIHTVPIPQITQPSQLLIRVSVSGSNPKDWKMATGTLMTISNCPNSGDDISGTVIAVGTSVLDFKPGDRVAALHELGTPYGSYAEYAIVNSWATFHLPEEMTFEEAATVPMATYMAAIGLFGMLRVTPGPWYAPSGGTPLVIYGASSAVGAAVVKLAGISGVHPLICVAGAGQAFVETLIDRSKGDTIFDYREGPESVVRSIKEVLGGRDLEYVFDAISENGSHHYFCGALGQKRGKVTFVLGGYREDIPGGIEQSTTMAGCLWKSLKGADPRSRLGMETGGTDFAFAYSRLIGAWLQDGRLKIHPFEVVDGGLAGVETALKRLREGKPSAKKFVVRISDD